MPENNLCSIFVGFVFCSDCFFCQNWKYIGILYILLNLFFPPHTFSMGSSINMGSVKCENKHRPGDINLGKSNMLFTRVRSLVWWVWICTRSFISAELLRSRWPFGRKQVTFSHWSGCTEKSKSKSGTAWHKQDTWATIKFWVTVSDSELIVIEGLQKEKKYCISVWQTLWAIMFGITDFSDVKKET